MKKSKWVFGIVGIIIGAIGTFGGLLALGKWIDRRENENRLIEQFENQ